MLELFLQFVLLATAKDYQIKEFGSRGLEVCQSGRVGRSNCIGCPFHWLGGPKGTTAEQSKMCASTNFDYTYEKNKIGCVFSFRETNSTKEVVFEDPSCKANDKMETLFKQQQEKKKVSDEKELVAKVQKFIKNSNK